ncbi:MAG: hypothetical protein JXN64_14460 [Spirochaetes bacterium]|nr:hypothetical protein [Spirochaetota bacterium]
MKKFFRNKRILLLLSIFIISSIIACYDNFENAIKEENKNTETGNGNGGAGEDGWIKVTNIATVRAGAASVISNDSIYIYGGEDYNGIIDDFWRYDIVPDKYEILESYGPISYADLVELEGYLYIFGGKESGGTLSQNLKYYDISGKIWGEIEGPSGFVGPTPSARYSHISLAYTDASTGDRTIFVHGGFTDTGDADGVLYQLNIDDVNPSGKPRWTELNFNVIMGAHSAAVYNNRIYFFGGYVSGTDNYLNQFYVYDIAGDTYSTLNPDTVISARSGIKSIVAENGVYTYGGENASGCLNGLWFYSFTGNAWEMISTGPDKRSHYNSFKYSDSILLYGGYYLNSSDDKVFNSELWQYPIDK